MEKVIIGAGGFAREIKASLGFNEIKFFVDDLYVDEGNNVFGFSKLDVKKHTAIIAVGSPVERKNIQKRLPKDLSFFTFVDPRATILSDSIKIGMGSIICAGSILTTDVVIGAHVIINLNVTIGHDSIINDFTTVSPGVNISGNCNIGKLSYLGSNSCLREGVTLCDQVVVGMNGAVISSIDNPGTYVGIPAKLKL